MLLLDFSFSDTLEPFSINSKRIRSFQPHEAKKQRFGKTIRYHYTSANALMAILKGQTKGFGSVRFTDARYMNDRSEHMFFIKCLLEYIDKHRKEYQYCQDIIGDLLLQNHTEKEYLSLSVSELDEFETQDIIFTKTSNFLFCLSKEDDSLHMWNYYIHNGNYQGYNIGIHVNDFLKNFANDSSDKNDPIRFYCGDVIYEKTAQEKEIEILCKAIETFGDKTKPFPDEKIGRFPSNTQLAMAYLWQYIQCCGLFYKDESFADEKEYRIVIQFDRYIANQKVSSFFNSKNTSIKFDFFDRNGVLVPYLSVPLAKEAVKQITMAPTMESRIASISMKEFLESNEYDKVDVEQSTIPIRF